MHVPGEPCSILAVPFRIHYGRLMASLTIKNLPAAVHRKLRARAALHGRSLNGEAIACLQAALGAEAVDPDTLLDRARALRRGVTGRLTDRNAAAMKEEGRR